MATKIKVYVVVPTDRDGKAIGPPLDAKLTHAAAHAIAKAHAPCKVALFLADKEPVINSQQASKEEANGTDSTHPV